MNNILDEITYSDGRMEDVVHLGTSTPAKLKLRTRTYEGINKNLNARRAPRFNAFSIPNAFMATDDTSDGGVGFSVTDASDFENGQLKEKPNRLKINTVQRNVLQSNGVNNLSDSVVSEEENPIVQEDVQPTVAVSQPEGDNIPMPSPVPVEEGLASTDTMIDDEQRKENNIETETSSPQTNEVVEMQADVNPLDVAREKILNSQPQQEIKQESGQDVVDKAMKMDDFAKLEQAREEFEKANQELQEVVSLKQQRNDEKDVVSEEADNILKEISNKDTSIKEQTEVRDSTKKSNAQLEEEIAKLQRVMNQRRSLFNNYTKKIQRNKEVVLEEVKQIDEDIQSIKATTLENKQKLEKMSAEYDALLAETDAERNRGEVLQNRLNELNEINNAITLPEELDSKFQNEFTEKQTETNNNTNKVIDIDFEAPDFSFDDVDPYSVDNDKVMSIGRKRAA